MTTPLLVLGADEDGAHTRKEVLATARAYRTQAEFFPDMGHNMMLEPGWTAVAERIDSWLGTRGLVSLARHDPLAGINSSGRCSSPRIVGLSRYR